MAGLRRSRARGAFRELHALTVAVQAAVKKPLGAGQMLRTLPSFKLGASKWGALALAGFPL